MHQTTWRGPPFLKVERSRPLQAAAAVPPRGCPPPAPCTPVQPCRVLRARPRPRPCPWPSLPPRRLQDQRGPAGGRRRAAGRAAAVPRGARPGRARGAGALESGAPAFARLQLQREQRIPTRVVSSRLSRMQWTAATTFPTLATAQFLGVRLPSGTDPNWYLEGAPVSRDEPAGRGGARAPGAATHAARWLLGQSRATGRRGRLAAKQTAAKRAALFSSCPRPSRRATCWVWCCSRTAPPAPRWCT